MIRTTCNTTAMNDRNRIKTWVIILLILMNIGSLSMVWLSSGGGPESNPKSTGVHDFLMSELGWDKDQVAEYEALRKSHLDESKELHQKITALKDKVFGLVVADATEGELDVLLSQIAASHADLDRLTYEHFKAIRAIGGDEQKAKFDKLWNEVKQKVLPTPGKRNAGPPPPR